MFQYGSKNAVVEPSGHRMTDRGFGLVDIPAALWRRKLWPIALAVLFAIAAIAITMTMPDRYQATSQVLIDPRELKVLANEVSPQGLNSDSTTAYLESQTRIITSTNMLRRIVDREGLTKDSEYTSAFGVLARLFPVSAGGDQTLRVADQLGKNLWVKRGERTFVIDIAMTSTTPEKAARLANAFAAAYLEDQTNSRAEQARRTSTALTSRLNELRDRVRKSEEKVETYKGLKNIVGASGKLITEEQLAAVNSQLAFAKSRLADAKAKLEQIDSVKGQAAERGALPEAVNSQTLGLLRQQLGEAQRKSANMTTSLGPMHPEYLAAQSTVRDAQRAVGDEINRIRQAARSESDRAISNERSLQAQVDGLKKETLSGGRDTVELRELERDLEANRSLYQSFLQRARETGEQERVDSTNARIIATAVPPNDRTGPPRRLIVTGAATAGFMLGLFLGLLFEILARGIGRQPKAISEEVIAPTPVEPEAVALTSRIAAPVFQNQPSVAPVAATPQIEQPIARAAYQTPGVETRSAPQPPNTSSDDLMRLLRMLGQLEKAIDQHGIQR
jgi:uncharacterized protein involved in exopolysaccharide biosynthesis